jgi:DNA-binding CsgD family transcriptional regulator
MVTLKVAGPDKLEAYTLTSAGGEYVLFVLDQPAAKPRAELTVVERDLIDAVLAGMTNQQIALRRGRSRYTIGNQLAALYRKLGIEGRNELVACFGPERP